VAKTAVLKWQYTIEPSGDLLRFHLSNVSNNGDIAVAITYKKRSCKYSELMLFNNEGKIEWNKLYDYDIDIDLYNPQLSNNGNIIAVQVSDHTLKIYNRMGILLETLKEEKILDYKLLRSGNSVIILSEASLALIRGLTTGYPVYRWTKYVKGKPIKIAVSPNNKYIVVASYYEGNTRVTLYKLNGAELWSTVIKGHPLSVDVSNYGEVLLVTRVRLEKENISHTYNDVTREDNEVISFIVGGRVLWTHYCDNYAYCYRAQFTRSGDKIFVVKDLICPDYCLSVEVFNKEGRPLKYYSHVHDFAISDDCYVLGGDDEVILVSADGEVLQSISLGKKQGLIEYFVDVNVAPNGKYFVAVEAEAFYPDIKYLYFFEVKDLKEDK